MSDLIGKQISHYKIIEIVGQGGMGVVYKAEDTFLYRHVAVKTLPADLVSNSEFIQRIIQEARTASSLNHPNICTIYDVIEQDNQYFIIMEYIEGETVREIIRKSGYLPAKKVLDIMLKVCDALKAAHSKNIIHRDVKPENIMVTGDGYVKIMDFGLAKLRTIQDATKDKTGTDKTEKIDSDSHKTARSTLLGTVTYMAPEQLENKKVDERTDIFSVGVVLYELLTGHLPFSGKYVYEVSKAILQTDPQRLSEFNKKINPELENIVLKTLSKSPSDRYENVGELCDRLKNVKAKLNRKKIGIKKGQFVFAVVALLLLIFFLSKNMLFKAKIPYPIELKPITTTSKILEVGTSISPDGKSVAYSSDENGNMDLWVQQIATGRKINLTENYHGRDDGGIWSPDSKRLAFISARENGGIFIISKDGGKPRKIVAEASKNLRWLCWSPDGSKLAYTVDERLYIIAVDSGSPEHIPLPHNCMFLDWSPICNRIVYVPVFSYSDRYKYIWTVNPDGSDPKVLIKEAGLYQFPTWSRDGKYVFFKSMKGGTRDIWWIPVNKQGESIGIPKQLTVGTNAYDMSLSHDGKRLVYTWGGYEYNIWTIHLGKNRKHTIKEANQITHEKHQITFIAISPDNEKFAYSLNKGGGKEWEIWIVDKDGKNRKRIFVENAGIGKLSWSPDSKKIAFLSYREGEGDIYTIPVKGGIPTPIVSNPARDLSPVWSPCGDEIVFNSDRSGSFDLWLVSVSNGEQRRLTNSVKDEGRACWSPDGRYIAYISNETGSWEINIIPANGGKPRQLTNIKFQETDLKHGEIMNPIWSAKGDFIYTTYLSNVNDKGKKIIAVSVKDGYWETIYDFTSGSLQWEPSASIAADGENLFFVPKYYLGDIWLAELEYR